MKIWKQNCNYFLRDLFGNWSLLIDIWFIVFGDNAKDTEEYKTNESRDCGHIDQHQRVFLHIRAHYERDGELAQTWNN